MHFTVGLWTAFTRELRGPRIVACPKDVSQLPALWSALGLEVASMGGPVSRDAATPLTPGQRSAFALSVYIGGNSSLPCRLPLRCCPNSPAVTVPRLALSGVFWRYRYLQAMFGCFQCIVLLFPRSSSHSRAVFRVPGILVLMPRVILPRLCS